MINQSKTPIKTTVKSKRLSYCTVQSVCCKQIIRSETFKNSQTNEEELQVNFNKN